MYSVLFSLIFLMFSCGKDDDVIIEPAEDIDLQFRLLNENGMPATTFEPGENFIFSFSIVNNSKEYIALHSFNYEDFCRVIKHQSYNPRQNKSEETDMGKPYVNMFCHYVNGYQITPGGSLDLEIQWMPVMGSKYESSIFCDRSNTSSLEPGLYSTGFQSSFLFDVGENEFNSERKNFDITFEIK